MVYISFCFCVVSLLTLIGYFIGDEVSCNRQVYNKTLNFLTEKTIKQVGSKICCVFQNSKDKISNGGSNKSWYLNRELCTTGGVRSRR